MIHLRELLSDITPVRHVCLRSFVFCQEQQALLTKLNLTLQRK